ncbi:hypothetical protein NS355_07645 [Sphingomonas yabuuchiae]|uniref:Uncharacterized protein n=1 Tax=Sphingomonas yabuuchiae TaxID=172044 RepID=A0A147IUR6_9SPHN|nr:hypothetical protein [Sphingomonas yabuuchiae]KTT99096.1 hypothetical protein NS355_07645 [Sphingomonas yabuuchiae]
MTSALSPLPTASLRSQSTSLALPKPEGLAAPDAPQDADGVAMRAKNDATVRAKSRNPQGDMPGGGRGGLDGRHVVDERVIESGDMRITVISYSDGSVDRLSAMKNAGTAPPPALTPAEPSGAKGWGNRGMMVDRIG